MLLKQTLANISCKLMMHNPPSHIVVPALHKNKEQIRDVFAEKLGYTKTSKPEELAASRAG